MNRAAAVRLAVLALACAALYAAARNFLALPCWSVVFVVALFAWPLWCAHSEFALFQRRALLAGATLESSPVRRWLWTGSVTRVVLFFGAVSWAVLTLAFAALLDHVQWLVLAADALLLAIAYEPVRRRLAADVREEYRGLVARRWPLALANMALLAIAFFVLDFAVVGAPDTRGLTWLEVFDRSWESVQALAACPASGALLGVIAAADALGWHAAQVMIPALGHGELKLAAWGFFLLQAGLLAYGFTRLMLGAIALAERRAWRGSEGALPKAFWIPLLLLVAAWLYLSMRAEGLDAEPFRAGARSALAAANPCKPDTAALATLSAGLGAELARARAEAHANADRQLDLRLRGVFEEAELGVDRYLDWYFTVLGEYQRLGALAASELDDMMARELEKHLFGDGMLGERLERASMAVAAESRSRMEGAAARLGTGLREGVRANPCKLGAVDLQPTAALARDVARVSTAAGGGAMVGIMAVRSFGRMVAAATARRAASKSVFRMAGGLLGKQAAKRGSSWAFGGAAAALCAPGGPLAIACGVGGFVVSWLFFDHALIRIDEALFRDDMRAEIVSGLREQQAALDTALRAQHHASIDQMAAAVDAAIERTFIPARDG
jgi:hypothetical protein